MFGDYEKPRERYGDDADLCGRCGKTRAEHAFRCESEWFRCDDGSRFVTDDAGYCPSCGTPLAEVTTGHPMRCALCRVALPCGPDCGLCVARAGPFA